VSDHAVIEFLGQLGDQHRLANRKAAALVQVRTHLRARYDAAQSTEKNRYHWQHADLLSADAANSKTVRDKLRSRARYELHEANAFGNGIVHTLANDVIGTGPRLQVTTDNRDFNQRFEREFHAWMRAAKIARKLHAMRIAKCVDGECFALFVTNWNLRTSVKLDLKLIEADLVTTPGTYQRPNTANRVDGVHFDDNGDPTAYDVLRNHPGGDNATGTDPWAYNEVPAEFILHLFHRSRPGQHRGIPELTTSLPLFALLRRYTLAVVAAAEIAADFAGILHTDAASGTEGEGSSWDQSVEAFDSVDVDRGMFTALPFGWDLRQLRAEQPTTVYEMFRNAILNEIARPLNMPANIARCDSSGYNYASGRLDHMTYDLANRVERQNDWEPEICDRILDVYLTEARVASGVLLRGMRRVEDLQHSWFWDGREDADVENQANARKTDIESGVSHRTREYARKGCDVDEEDQKAADSFGVSVEEYRQALFRTTFTDSINAPFDTGTNRRQNEDGDEEEKTGTARQAA